MVNLPNEFFNLLSSSTLVEKRAMLIALSNNIREIETVTKNNHQSLLNYVQYTPSFISDKTLINGIEEELQTMKLAATNTKSVKNLWLNSSQEPYSYTGSKHATKLISDFPNIKKVMEMLNESEHSPGFELNACLISCYSTANKALNLHADDEKDICQLSSICNLSIGSTRTIEFVPKISNYSGDPVCTFNLEHGSLNTMKPGCQQVLKHRVIPGEHQPNIQNVRYCLSFKRFAKKPEANLKFSPRTPVKLGIQIFEKLGDGYQPHNTTELLTPEFQSVQIPQAPQIDIPQAPQIDTVLFAGDSHFERLDPAKLGKNKVNVVNIAKGGSRICDTEAAISVLITPLVISLKYSSQSAPMISDIAVEVSNISQSLLNYSQNELS